MTRREALARIFGGMAVLPALALPTVAANPTLWAWLKELLAPRKTMIVVPERVWNVESCYLVELHGLLKKVYGEKLSLMIPEETILSKVVSFQSPHRNMVDLSWSEA